MVGVIDCLTAAQVVDRIFQGFFAHALAQQQFAEFAVLVHGGEQHQFTGDELITLLLGQAVSLVEQARQILRHVHVAGGILDFRQLIEGFGQFFTQAVDVKTHLHQQGFDRTTLLFKHGLHQVRRLNGGTARDWASDKANCNLLVKRSIRMGHLPFEQAGPINILNEETCQIPL